VSSEVNAETDGKLGAAQSGFDIYIGMNGDSDEADQHSAVMPVNVPG
jgi:hypothetical protein